jgi:hypothetical protein
MACVTPRALAHHLLPEGFIGCGWRRSITTPKGTDQHLQLASGPPATQSGSYEYIGCRRAVWARF